MTVAELYQGAYRAGWGAKQIERLESRIAAYVVIPSSHAISKRWGEVRFIRRAQPISPEDAWVAAAALQQGYPLVTHNARDFQSIPGLTIITESV
jgi:tRNA(fMet)-specific endonuclease VapC